MKNFCFAYWFSRPNRQKMKCNEILMFHKCPKRSEKFFENHPTLAAVYVAVHNFYPLVRNNLYVCPSLRWSIHPSFSLSICSFVRPSIQWPSTLLRVDCLNSNGLQILCFYHLNEHRTFGLQKIMDQSNYFV